MPSYAQFPVGDVHERPAGGETPPLRTLASPVQGEVSGIRQTEGLPPIQSIADTSIAPRQSPARRANIECDLSHTRGPGV